MQRFWSSSTNTSLTYNKGKKMVTRPQPFGLEFFWKDGAKGFWQCEQDDESENPNCFSSQTKKGQVVPDLT